MVGSGINPSQLTTQGTLLDLADERLQSANDDRDDETMADRFRQEAGGWVALHAQTIQFLTAAGAKRKADLTPEELAALEPPKTARSPSTGPREKKPPAGVKHFLKLMYDGEPEWSLLAVQAPLDKVTEAFAQCYPAAKMLHGVEIKKTCAGDELAHSVAILQIKDNPWTVIQLSLLYVNEKSLSGAVDNVRILSEKLKTKAISFVAEDKSGTLAYMLFDGGKLVEQAQWTDGGSFSIFESTRRKQPKLDEVTDNFVDKVFKDLGIYLPACYPRGAGKKACICSEKKSLDFLATANILELAQ